MANVFTPTIATDVKAQKRVRKWIRALRSGEYVQGTGGLRTSYGHSLGSSCDAVRKLVAKTFHRVVMRRACIALGRLGRYV
jgi:hypothetical protein